MTDLNFPKLLADAERRYAGIKHDAQALLAAMREAAVTELHGDMEAAGKIRRLMRNLTYTIENHEKEES